MVRPSGALVPPGGMACLARHNVTLAHAVRTYDRPLS